MCVCLCLCLHARPCLLELGKCSAWRCWSPGCQCVQQWKSEGLVLSPAYEGAFPALKQPFICAQGLEMTMQPLLIAPDGAINKAMIYTGPVLTLFFTLQSLTPQGPPYLMPPLCSSPSSSSSSKSLYQNSGWSRCFHTDCTHILQMPNEYQISYTALHSRVNGL